jgi:hypothetical protein
MLGPTTLNSTGSDQSDQMGWQIVGLTPGDSRLFPHSHAAHRHDAGSRGDRADRVGKSPLAGFLMDVGTEACGGGPLACSAARSNAKKLRFE